MRLFIFSFFGFTRITHNSFILFFILRRSYISTHAWDDTFYFLFFGFTRFTYNSFILFFILRRSYISTWLLMWERNLEVEKKKQFSDKK